MTSRAAPDLPGFRYDPVLNRYFSIDRLRPSATAATAPIVLETCPSIDSPHHCSIIRSLRDRELGCSALPFACRRCSHQRHLTMSQLRPASSTTQLTGNQAIALADDVVIAAGSSLVSTQVSEMKTAVLSDNDPVQVVVDPDLGVIGARSASMFTSVSVYNDFLCYSTLGDTVAGSVFIQNINEAEVAMQFTIPKRSVWSCAPIPCSDCLAIGCSRGALILDTERRWKRPLGRPNVDVVCVQAESPTSLFGGSRSGFLDQIDVRAPTQLVASARLDSSVTWIQPMSGEVRLLAATSSGTVSLIDRRRYRPVLSYVRPQRSGSLAPVRACVDFESSCVFIQGGEGVVRCFDIGNGSVLYESRPLGYGPAPMTWSYARHALLIGTDNGIEVLQIGSHRD